MFEPELLKFADGEQVTAENWERRRCEILDILRTHEYGYSPKPPEAVKGEVLEIIKKCASGHAAIERIKLSFETEKGEFSFPFNLILPRDKDNYKENLPVFVMINFQPDVYDMYYPLEEITDNGFALAVFNYKDVTSDDGDMENGLLGMYSKRNDGTDWGKISAWAFAASRIVDYLYTRKEIDKNNIAVCGHSRLGKTALWCGAQDTRIKLACSNDSGCAGAAYERIKHEGAETAKIISTVFPYWFCTNYFRYADDFTKAPFDQHFLIAANCPRYVCVGSATLDNWADQYSEQLSCIGASPAWELLGREGFVGTKKQCGVGCGFYDGDISYHLRHGEHFFGREDWQSYMKFFKKIMGE